MLATDLQQLEYLAFPYIIQPKLNGFRARWDGTTLLSRQLKAWSPNALPHIYAKLRDFSSRHPDVILDGELYCHGLPFEQIERRCAVKRQCPHAQSGDIDFHAFDIVSVDDAESRQVTLSQIYKPWVAVARVESKADVDNWLKTFIEYGYEGAILRAYGCGYIVGRTEALVKVKVVKYATVTIRGTYEGEGKFAGMLGGFNVVWGKVTFNVGGGNITEQQRQDVWNNRCSWLGQKIIIAYRDVYNSGRPVQPQIFRLV